MNTDKINIDDLIPTVEKQTFLGTATSIGTSNLTTIELDMELNNQSISKQEEA